MTPANDLEKVATTLTAHTWRTLLLRPPPTPVSWILLALGVFVLILFPAGLAAFGAALRHARREGSLIHS